MALTALLGGCKTLEGMRPTLRREAVSGSVPVGSGVSHQVAARSGNLMTVSSLLLVVAAHVVPLQVYSVPFISPYLEKSLGASRPPWATPVEPWRLSALGCLPKKANTELGFLVPTR